MARSRNIKPGFCQNEKLVELSFETRLTFALLPMFADREGRLEDRPKRVKMQMFPADNIEMDRVLQELHDAGFIQRYTIENNKYIQIVNFSKHQNPHVNEKPSEIPGPPQEDGSTVQAPEQHGSNPADSLISDSLIPDSLQNTSVNADGDDSAKTPPCPHLEIIAAYHETLPELPRVVESLWPNSTDAANLQARWRSHPEHQDLDFWRGFFEVVRTNPHWMGENDRGWKANLRWLVNKTNFTKVAERWANAA